MTGADDGSGGDGIRRVLAALRVPNFRRYFAGQAVSLSGTWMQRVAQSWLVLDLSDSGTKVGIVVGLQTIPVVLIAPLAGLVADRTDKRRLIEAVQWVMSALAGALALLTLTGVVEYWHVCALALALGVASTFEMPARQAFLVEMVGEAELTNAIGLNSALVNLARSAGPVAAGLVIEQAGTGMCFAVNAVSFLGVIALLRSLDESALLPPERAPKARGQIAETAALIRVDPSLAAPLAMILLIGCVAYEFEVTLPVLAARTFAAGPTAYGFMTAAMGAGAVVGGLVTAGHATTGLKPLAPAAVVFAAAMALTAAAPTLTTCYMALGVLGAVAMRFVILCNATLQLAAPAGSRGRVLSLWQAAYIGSRTAGGPAVGVIAQHAGARWAFAAGAAACLAAAAIGWKAARDSHRQGPPPRD
ncbi:MAG: MFS transporter [Bifidobacteriaceae bacterium]|jgi:MFS family permease|nr:MFS transporter [Bifidobacteriaceae bacterium]